MPVVVVVKGSVSKSAVEVLSEHEVEFHNAQTIADDEGMISCVMGADGVAAVERMAREGQDLVDVQSDGLEKMIE